MSSAIIQLITVIILHLIITTRIATTPVAQATETNTVRVRGRVGTEECGVWSDHSLTFTGVEGLVIGVFDKYLAAPAHFLVIMWSVSFVICRVD